MVGETPKQAREPLLPLRHEEGDLFLCDMLEAPFKDDVASMEHPIFSLSTKPDIRPRRYEHNGNILEVLPSSMGLATIHDKDVLIYAVSHLVQAINEGRPLSRTVRLRAHDLLVKTNRQTDGDGYARLKDAFTRLRGTTLRTSIKTGGEETTSIFGLVDEANIVRKTFDGRMVEAEITLSKWLFRAVAAREVLTIHPDYFRLRKPLERRLYELARKHCGQQSSWLVTLEVLQKKCGSSSTLKEFRRLIAAVIQMDGEYQHMPDYGVRWRDDTQDAVMFERRDMARLCDSPSRARVHLSADAMEKARGLARGWDLYVIENDWRVWMADSGGDPPKNPDAAFLGFVKKWVAQKKAA